MKPHSVGISYNFTSTVSDRITDTAVLADLEAAINRAGQQAQLALQAIKEDGCGCPGRHNGILSLASELKAALVRASLPQSGGR